MRLRRDTLTRDASTVAAHIAFIYGDAPASVTSAGAAGGESSLVPDLSGLDVLGGGGGGVGGGGGGSSGSGSGGGSEPARVLDARQAFVLLSTRVYLNVHHDFELEPDEMLGQGKQTRKRALAATAHTSTSAGELGYAPLEVFDLWQRTLHPMLRWLASQPAQASDVMEATVRLLSGKSDGRAKEGPRTASALDGVRLSRTWGSMAGCGCEGRFMPVGSSSSSGGGKEDGGGLGGGALLAERSAGWGPRMRPRRSRRRPRAATRHGCACVSLPPLRRKSTCSWAR